MHQADMLVINAVKCCCSIVLCIAVHTKKTRHV